MRSQLSSSLLTMLVVAPNKNHILAAFHLPYGGNDVLYPSISSVNHFRAMSWTFTLV